MDRSRRTRRTRGTGWPALVALSALVAGLLFGTSARTARGTDLRGGRRSRLTELIAIEEHRVAGLDRTARTLRREVEAVTEAAAGRDVRVKSSRAAGDRLLGPAGLAAVEGPGLVVSLDDAPRPPPGEQRPGNPAPDDLVVHEQDVLAVINALWTGGAEAVSVMGERVINTSAVRCVGNTLLVHGAVYSPPFVIAGIGNAAALAQALGDSSGVALFRSYVAAFGLGYQAVRQDRIQMPAYGGPVQLRHSRVG